MGRLKLAHQRFNGRPVVFENDTRPYDDLEAVQGRDHPDPIVRHIAKRTFTIQQRVLGIMMILPDRLLRQGVQTPEEVLRLDLMTEKMQDRIGTRDFLAISESGSMMFLGNQDKKTWKILGAFTPDVHDQLEKDRQRKGDLNERHTKFLLELVHCPPNGMIIETGAGRDYARIRALDALAKAHGGVLICHDLPPLAAKTAKTYVPGVPYLILPPDAKILAYPFEGTTERPKIVTLKDTLSSMNIGSLLEFLAFLEMIKPERVLITQAHSMGNISDLIQRGMKFGDLFFLDACEKTFSLELRALFQSPYRDFLLRFLAVQADITRAHLLMEIHRRNVIERGKIIGLPFTKTVIVDQEKTFPQEEAVQFVKQYFPNLEEAFLEGRFNTILQGPFEKVLLSREGLPPGSLAFVSEEFTLVLMKQDDDEDLMAHQRGKELMLVPEHEFLTPKQLRRADVLNTAIGVFLEGEKDPRVSLPDWNEIRTMEQDGTIDQVLRVGRKLGIDLVFDAVSEAAEPWVERQRKDLLAIKKAFVELE